MQSVGNREDSAEWCKGFGHAVRRDVVTGSLHYVHVEGGKAVGDCPARAPVSDVEFLQRRRAENRVCRRGAWLGKSGRGGAFEWDSLGCSCCTGKVAESGGDAVNSESNGRDGVMT
jgi:hypothetical protein